MLYCDVIYEIGGVFSGISFDKPNENLSGKVDKMFSIIFKHNIHIYIWSYFSSRRILYKQLGWEIEDWHKM